MAPWGFGAPSSGNYVKPLQVLLSLPLKSYSGKMKQHKCVRQQLYGFIRTCARV